MVKTAEEIEFIRESSLIVSDTLAELATHLKPGITGLQLDKIAEEFIRDHGATPSFKGYGGFPNTICFSVNEAVVHGIPSDKGIKEGDVVSIDIGAYKNGFHGDQGFSFAMAGMDDKVLRLLRVTRESLALGIEQAIVGKRVGDIGHAIQSHCEKNGYGVVRELVGHGLGAEIHEDPEVPNYGMRGRGKKLQENMVLAIEPMINLGTRKVASLDDNWTIVTQDQKPSAHYEHDIAVKKDKAEILTDFDRIDEAIKTNKNLLEIVV